MCILTVHHQTPPFLDRTVLDELVLRATRQELAVVFQRRRVAQNAQRLVVGMFGELTNGNDNT